MLVYREASEECCGPELLRRCIGGVGEALYGRTESALDALITAGELEVALTDARHEAAARLAQITDAAAAVIAQGSVSRLALAAFGRIDVPRHVRIRPPEGFAYYALHPLQYCAIASTFLRERRDGRRAAVIGIRSIGAPLSAIVAASLRKHGVEAERLTVRPSGNTSARELHLDQAQCRWITEQNTRGADFLIVDEGPGRSGSSFLATAEAMVREGIEAQRITLFCSYEPDVAALLAPEAASRWRRFRALWPKNNSRPLPRDAGQDLSAGEWRNLFFPAGARWPAAAVGFERMKFLSQDRQAILKFEGYGHYGSAVLQRSKQIAEAGFGPSCEDAGNGFVHYRRAINSRIGGSRIPNLNCETLARLAAYCAFRARAFMVGNVNSCELQRMAACNLEQLRGSAAPHLPVVCGVIADGRMAPHEWVQDDSGVLLKTDAAAHGDDHFYPGRADIAWDLAGAIVEWQMPPAAAREFLDLYESASGDDASQRVTSYLAAYLAFRIALLEMAAQSSPEVERARLLREVQRYRLDLGTLVFQPLAQSA